ncbi:hypothetical protein GGS23DRAFT_571190 [Durotheca rogersii]|uniref:uncharacterized protein n=1 Tax=Durotheca rogersii TaxID=419775 RepID=UPI0022201494|nr:uncharacterized protein GGS23DRAFT_571190 [Durotheca rogersii]KAI5862671.1 hypothetical protein GGS23DRAFT_571190 [Durotheca rogersii]
MAVSMRYPIVSALWLAHSALIWLLTSCRSPSRCHPPIGPQMSYTLLGRPLRASCLTPTSSSSSSRPSPMPPPVYWPLSVSLLLSPSPLHPSIHTTYHPYMPT